MNLLFSHISVKRLSAYLILLLSIITVLLHCTKEEDHSPQTQKECLDVAEFGLPGESPYCLPFAIDSSYLLTQSYCSGGGKSHHSRFAYDFKMPFGTEILAARAGEVVELREHFSDEDSEGGHENMVSLRHEDETISLYIHMMQNGVKVELGDYVEKGELLGWIGSSGTGFAHLHFQVCLRSGMCSYPSQEFTMPINFRNGYGPLDERGGLVEGNYYMATDCR